VYDSGERELYDDVADPHQLRNLAADPALAQTMDELQAELEVMRSG
jgi:hypothetical protein